MSKYSASYKFSRMYVIDDEGSNIFIRALDSTSISVSNEIFANFIL